MKHFAPVLLYFCNTHHFAMWTVWHIQLWVPDNAKVTRRLLTRLENSIFLSAEMCWMTVEPHEILLLRLWWKLNIYIKCLPVRCRLFRDKFQRQSKGRHIPETLGTTSKPFNLKDLSKQRWNLFLSTNPRSLTLGNWKIIFIKETLHKVSRQLGCGYWCNKKQSEVQLWSKVLGNRIIIYFPSI